MRWANRRKPPSSLRRLLDEGIASLLRSCRMHRHHRTHTQDYQHLVRFLLLLPCHRPRWKAPNLVPNQVMENPGRLWFL